MKDKTLIILLLLVLLTSRFELLAMSEEFCVKSAKTKVVDTYPYFETILQDPKHPANYYIELDCRESLKITEFKMPYNDTVGALKKVAGVSSRIRLGGISNAMKIMTPYCRQNHEYFGSFCMAADTYSANEILNTPALLEKLPLVIETLASKLKENLKVDFVEETINIFPDDIREAVTLAAFLGLDDNGTQTMRLKASLLKLGAFTTYAKLFPLLADGLQVKDRDGKFSLSPISIIFFATRVGNATLPGVDEKSSKTYKAYAGLYFGCKMGELGHSSISAKREIALFGYTYETIKVSSSLKKDLNLRSELLKYHKLGKETGAKMSTAATLGHSLCK